MLKFFDVILLSLAIGFFIIGVHQSIVLGFGNSYWIFMLTLVLLLWVKMRNNKKNDDTSLQKVKKPKKISGKKERSK